MTNRWIKTCSFCGNAIEMVEQGNGKWKALDEFGNPHYCLRDRKSK